MFSIFQETPFTTVDLEFVYFFFPFIITGTIPTLLSVGWKNVNPNRVLTDEQFWLATCYVQVGQRIFSTSLLHLLFLIAFMLCVFMPTSNTFVLSLFCSVVHSF